IYVLGGSPLERGERGAELLLEGLAPVVYCTGELVPTTLLTLGLTHTEGELSRYAAIEAGADSSMVQALNVGTSTFEEADAIIAHAQQAGYSHITIVSTEFHLRRVRRVFRKRAKDTGVSIHVLAAASQRYDSARWWESEEGLLMVNNEYVKLLYYWLRY
ncbi:MAG: ElyC/SanA/YdcF family protein, partial [Flavobacteriales bacterium]